MLLIKACPRCSGDMVKAETHEGPMASCVQCGFVRYAQAPVAAWAGVVASVVPPQPPTALERAATARSERRLPRRSVRQAQTSSKARRAA